MTARKTKGDVRMSHKDFVTEHELLVRVLRRGTPAQRQTEARKQAHELKEKR
jgi:hypothetical protein